jgi:hypothetical protein
MQGGILLIGGVGLGVYSSFPAAVPPVESVALAGIYVLFTCTVAFSALSYKSLTIIVTPEALVVSRITGTRLVAWSLIKVIERRPRYRAGESVTLLGEQAQGLFEIDSSIEGFGGLVSLLEANAPARTLVRERDKRGVWHERMTLDG